MIHLGPEVESQLISLASNKNINISDLIQNLMLNHQSEQEALNQADASYAEYKKLGIPLL